MKKLVCLVLSLAMLMSCTSAWAAPIITNLFENQDIIVPWGETKEIIKIDGNGSQVDWLLTTEGDGREEPAFYPIFDVDGKYQGNYEYRGSNQDHVVIEWFGSAFGDWTHNDGGELHHLYVDGLLLFDFYVDWISYGSDGEANYDRISMEQYKDPPLYVMPPYWRDNTKIFTRNTVCSFGPHFRDITPEMTDKWYMFTPVDLSRDGKQVYEMVGGNAYVIGTVSVTVNGDEVVVDYRYLPDVYAYDEFYTFFPDYDSVTTVNPEEIGTAYEYGQKLSIEKDLGGDTDVLLFTCNRATFKSNNDYIVRFYENVPWRASLREAMLNHIGKTEVGE